MSGQPQALNISREDVNANAKYAKDAVLKINPQDLRVWELVTDVPRVKLFWAYLCLALNVLIPGLGTMIVSCVGDENINKTQLGIGFVQMLTAPYIVGWICSIYWGYLFVKRTSGDHNDIKNLLNGANGAGGSAPPTGSR